MHGHRPAILQQLLVQYTCVNTYTQIDRRCLEPLVSEARSLGVIRPTCDCGWRNYGGGPCMCDAQLPWRKLLRVPEPTASFRTRPLCVSADIQSCDLVTHTCMVQPYQPRTRRCHV